MKKPQNGFDQILNLFQITLLRNNKILLKKKTKKKSNTAHTVWQDCTQNIRRIKR
jgi:hypothetical protein